MGRKAKKKQERKSRKRRALVALALGHAGVKLAITDDAGIERAIRKIWSWADSKLAQQNRQDVDRIGTLQRLQSKMSEAIDVLATLVGTPLDQFPDPTLTSRTGNSPAKHSDDAAARAARADEVARELMRDPAVRRGFLEHQKRMKEGTAMLNYDQLAIAKKMGMDRKTLAEFSLTAKPSTPRAGPPDTLTREQRKFAHLMQIADPDPGAVEEMAAAMRAGTGFELKPKPAAA